MAEGGPDNTGDKQGLTQFKPGTSGNPKGRPKGAKSKLGEDFVEALHADFEEHGVETIQLVRRRSPEVYLKVIKDVLPREVLVKAFSLNIDADAKDMADAESVEEILEIVAQEAGEEAAMVLVKMFDLEPPTIELEAQATEESIESREQRIRQIQADRKRWGNDRG